ncbi:phospholipase A(1) DAD1, chloroplastic-like [Primulina tabacum]|uniref:phospholipase A(1) DAD1, chloroplastic-like n=1 Tax=Primulina tabacum TaxID=48773 RepID=UPI003F5AC670
MEFQGIKNWEGLLDPLDDGLRDEILRYGEFVEAAYRCFEFDTSSPVYATCRYPKRTMLSDCGAGVAGYRVTKSLHATCGVNLPNWTERISGWVSTQSSWIGYVAVCNDKAEIARLGRRDVVIAYRGTATCMEWLENLRATLTCLPCDMAPENCESMVQSGFLSLYTSSAGGRPSLQDSIREEINKILEKYADEPLSITVTGHSLGAALATLTAHDINTTFKHAPLVTVVSFGGPRIGNKNFRRQLERNGTKVLRIVNSDDPITKVPGFVLEENTPQRTRNGGMDVASGLSNWLQKRMEDTQWVYAEIGKELRLSSRDCPYLSNGNVATCHDLKTYLHLVDNFVSSNCPLRATAKRVVEQTNIRRSDGVCLDGSIKPKASKFLTV